MEKNGHYSEQLYRPVNHADIGAVRWSLFGGAESAVNHWDWKKFIRSATTLGIADMINTSGGRSSRQAYALFNRDSLIGSIVNLYEQNTDEVTFYVTVKVDLKIDKDQENTTKVITNRKEFLTQWAEMDPKLVDTTGSVAKPSKGAYLWAQQQMRVIKGVLTPAQAEADFGFPYQAVDVSGDMDWLGILKKLVTFIIAVVGGFLVGGPAGAIAGAVSGYAAVVAMDKAASQATALQAYLGISKAQTAVAAKDAAAAEAQRILDEEAAKQASFLSLDFTSPFVIMPLMALGALALFMTFKHKK